MKITKEEARQLFYEYLVRVSASVEGSADRNIEFKSTARSAAIGFARSSVDHRGETDTIIIKTLRPAISYEFVLVKRDGAWALWLV